MKYFLSKPGKLLSHSAWSGVGAITAIISVMLAIIFSLKNETIKSQNHKISDPNESVKTTEYSATENKLADLLKENNGKSIIIGSKEFPDVEVLVTGDMNQYFPPYSIQFLFDEPNHGFILRHKEEIKSIFFPLIILGKKMEITNYHRSDMLGIRLKTDYLTPKERKIIIDKAATVIFNLFYTFGGIPKTEKLTLEQFKSNMYPKIPVNLWPDIIEQSEWTEIQNGDKL